MDYLFLPEDLKMLDEKINGINERVKKALKRIGDSCDGGDSWHDNFSFEQAQRDAEMWSNQLRALIAVKNNAKVVYPEDFRRDKVNIGKTVTTKYEGDDSTMTFRVGSYMVLNKEKSNAISYKTPLVKAILGAKVGEIREARIAGKNKKIKIVQIK